MKTDPGIKSTSDSIPNQDEADKLWDFVCMLHFAIRKVTQGQIRFPFALYLRNANLWSTRYGRPADCITVMMPDED